MDVTKIGLKFKKYFYNFFFSYQPRYLFWCVPRKNLLGGDGLEKLSLQSQLFINWQDGPWYNRSSILHEQQDLKIIYDYTAMFKVASILTIILIFFIYFLNNMFIIILGSKKKEKPTNKLSGVGSAKSSSKKGIPHQVRPTLIMSTITINWESPPTIAGFVPQMDQKESLSGPWIL